MKIREALLEACSTRLRPIVMANLAIVVGMIPQIFGGSEGSELRTPMAIVQIGGVVVSALLTLFIIPDRVYICRQADRPRPQGAPGSPVAPYGRDPVILFK